MWAKVGLKVDLENQKKIPSDQLAASFYEELWCYYCTLYRLLQVTFFLIAKLSGSQIKS